VGGKPAPMLGMYMFGSVGCCMLVVVYVSRLGVDRACYSLFDTALPTMFG
jgi:hypothetical protein